MTTIPSFPLKKIISGGQTGADRAGLEVGRRLGYATGGTVPRGFRTEKGADRGLMAFGVIESSSSDYPPRTRRNVHDGDGTVWFGSEQTPGGKLTIGTARRERKPLIINPDPADLTRWIIEHHVETLNVAGDRESNDPGIQKRVEKILTEALSQLDTSGASANSAPRRP